MPESRQMFYILLPYSAETLFRWGRKRLYHFAANFFRKRCTKFY